MSLFGKKRGDGILINDIDPLATMMPYIMRGRNESAIYYRDTVLIDNMQNYIREKRREGMRITLFHLILTACLQLIHLRPNLNRFIAGRRLYAHKDFDILFVVKESLDDDSRESIARISLSENDNLFTVSRQINDRIKEVQAGAEKWDDLFFSKLSHFPRWSLRAIANVLFWADFRGLLPKSFTDMIPMFSSIFISHLGSIGGDSPFHHLYEFGTTSIFMTVGKIYKKPFESRSGETEWRKALDLCFTVDERISDGYYLIKSINLLNDLLQYPQLLEYSPAELKKMTPEEYNELKRKYGHHGGETVTATEDQLSHTPY